VLRGLAWGLIAVSVAIQVLGISVDLRTWEVKWLVEKAAVWGGIGQAIEGLMLVPAESPVAGHLRLLLSGTQPLDFAWVQWRPLGAWAFVPAGFIMSLGLVVVAVVFFVVSWRAERRTGSTIAAGGMAILTLIVCTGLLLIYRSGDARFDPYDVDRFLRPMTQRLEADGCAQHGLQGAHCSDVLLIPDPALTDYFLNYLGGRIPWYGLDPKPVDETLAANLFSRYGRIWLGRDRNGETDDTEGRRAWERYLTDHAFKLSEERYGDWARLLLFSAPGLLAEESAPGQRLGEFTLERASLGLEARPAAGAAVAEPLDDGRVQARPGDTLQIGLRWRADARPEANYTAFVQLLDDKSQEAAQQDRWPGDGLHPTAALEAGQSISDNLALPLGVSPGRYRLIAGFYRSDVEGLPRLAGPAGDFVTLAEVDVQ
jgi:hypothetical protein